MSLGKSDLWDPKRRFPGRRGLRGVTAMELIDAGAKIYETDSDFPTDNEGVDELLRRLGMRS